MHIMFIPLRLSYILTDYTIALKLCINKMCIIGMEDDGDEQYGLSGSARPCFMAGVAEKVCG